MGTYDDYGVVHAWFCRRMKDDLSIQLQGAEGHYWLGTEAGIIGAYGFQGAVFATDGSVTNGKMGAGYSEMSWQMLGSEWQEAQPEEGNAGKLLKHPTAMDRGEDLTTQVQQQLAERGGRRRRLCGWSGQNLLYMAAPAQGLPESGKGRRGHQLSETRTGGH